MIWYNISTWWNHWYPNGVNLSFFIHDEIGLGTGT